MTADTPDATAQDIAGRLSPALMEQLVAAIHDGLDGNGWAYSDYGGDELRSCRKELENAAHAVFAILAAERDGGEPPHG